MLLVVCFVNLFLRMQVLILLIDPNNSIVKNNTTPEENSTPINAIMFNTIIIMLAIIMFCVSVNPVSKYFNPATINNTMLMFPTIHAVHPVRKLILLPYVCFANSYNPPALGYMLVSSANIIAIIILIKNNIIHDTIDVFPAISTPNLAPRNVPVPIMLVMLNANTEKNPNVLFNSIFSIFFVSFIFLCFFSFFCFLCFFICLLCFFLG